MSRGSRALPINAFSEKYQGQIMAQLLPKTGTLSVTGGVPSGPVHLGTEGPRLRQDRSGPNKTEAAFEAHLRAIYPKDEIHAQGMTLKLANGLRYTPDFVRWVDFKYQDEDECHLTFYEVKGFMRDDAAAKIKMAARLFKRVAFWLVTKRTRKQGGGWSIERVWP